MSCHSLYPLTPPEKQGQRFQKYKFWALSATNSPKPLQIETDVSHLMIQLDSYGTKLWNKTVRINNIKSLCLAPPPQQSHVSFVTAYYCSLPLIAHSSLYIWHTVHYTAFDTQLKTVSAKIHRSYFSNCLIFSSDYTTWVIDVFSLVSHTSKADSNTTCSTALLGQTATLGQIFGAFKNKKVLQKD